MPPFPVLAPQESRLGVLLDHFATLEDPRDLRRIAHPLAEVLLLVVCATLTGCDDYDQIAAWGEAHLGFLHRHLPYEHGTPGGRWLTILMNRINPALFSGAFTAWVRETWPGRPEFVAIYGKISSLPLLGPHAHGVRHSRGDRPRARHLGACLQVRAPKRQALRLGLPGVGRPRSG